MKPADSFHDCWDHFQAKHLDGAPAEQIRAMRFAFFSGGYVAARSLQLVIASGEFTLPQMAVGADMLVSDIASGDQQTSEGEVLQ